MIGLIPKMTSNTTPSGEATGSNYKSGQLYRAYYAFDQDISTIADLNYGTAYPLNWYTRYIFPNIVDIDYLNFGFAYERGGNGYWIDITLQVTYDGSSWENVKTERLTWKGSVKTIFAFNNLGLSNVKGIGLGATNSQSGYGSYFTEIQAYPPLDNNIFLEDNPLVIDDLGSEVSLTANFERAASLRYKVNGVWKYAIPYIKLNGN